jgi:hypothetical protein
MLNRLKIFIFKLRYGRHLAINNTMDQQCWVAHRLREKGAPKMLYDYGFSIFSQHEEDGILLHIFSLIGITNKKCVEMCVGTGLESNTANLIVNHYWHGLLFDGKGKNINIARTFYSLHKNTQIYPPKVVHAWINRENINQVISDNAFEGEIDLFSLDIDGVDYYLLEHLEVVSPRVIVLEINHLWGPEKSYSVPYDPNFKAEFTPDGSDYSGASLAAFIKLAKVKGYYFVGTNRFATNAFFIRNDIRHEHLAEVEDTSIYFKHPRVLYGMTERFSRIKDKEWQEIE